MKYLFSALLVAVTCTIVYAQPTIRRVNNNPGVTGVNVYSTAQGAHDAANANDILMIEPSEIAYTGLRVTKPIKIYGNGYFLDVNKELKLDKNSSKLNYVIFDPNSQGSEMNGVHVAGITESGSGNWSVIISGASNIIISRCLISYNFEIRNRNYANTTSFNVNNIRVINSLLKLDFRALITAGFTISDVLLTNNILAQLTASTNPGVQNWIVRNNTFNSGNPVLLANSVFESNILTVSTQATTLANTSYSYNISSGNAFSGGIGNQNNYDVLTQFIGTGTGISDDERYQIKVGTPLKTAGSGGTEVGAYGGDTPYIVSGIPAIPSIINMTNTATGSNTVPLQVTISVKGNN